MKSSRKLKKEKAVLDSSVGVWPKVWELEQSLSQWPAGVDSDLQPTTLYEEPKNPDQSLGNWPETSMDATRVMWSDDDPQDNSLPEVVKRVFRLCHGEHTDNVEFEKGELLRVIGAHDFDQVKFHQLVQNHIRQKMWFMGIIAAEQDQLPKSADTISKTFYPEPPLDDNTCAKKKSLLEQFGIYNGIDHVVQDEYQNLPPRTVALLHLKGVVNVSEGKVSWPARRDKLCIYIACTCCVAQLSAYAKNFPMRVLEIIHEKWQPAFVEDKIFEVAMESAQFCFQVLDQNKLPNITGEQVVQLLQCYQDRADETQKRIRLRVYKPPFVRRDYRPLLEIDDWVKLCIEGIPDARYAVLNYKSAAIGVFHKFSGRFGENFSDLFPLGAPQGQKELLTKINELLGAIREKYQKDLQATSLQGWCRFYQLSAGQPPSQSAGVDQPLLGKGMQQTFFAPQAGPSGEAAARPHEDQGCRCVIL
jgi:hypothetical protein